MKWIDSHVHIGADKDGKKNDLLDVKELFKKNWIDKAVIFCFNEKNGIKEGNKKIKKIIEKNKNIIGLYRLDPKKHTSKDLLGLENFKGFKLHPHSQKFKLRNITNYLEILEEIGKPVLIHVGHWGENPHPKEVVEAASQLNLPIIFAHSIRGYYFKAEQSIRKKFKNNENIYIDLSFQASHSAIEVLSAELGADRLLFASDYPYGHPLPVKKSIKLADISKKDKKKISHKNAEKLFL